MRWSCGSGEIVLDASNLSRRKDHCVVDGIVRGDTIEHYFRHTAAPILPLYAKTIYFLRGPWRACAARDAVSTRCILDVAQRLSAPPIIMTEAHGDFR